MNFKKAMFAEKIKFRRSPVFLAFVVLTMLAAVLGTFNYANNVAILKDGWLDLWSQHTLFACSIFLPAELGVLCAWQWRLEHTDHCWNTLMTVPLPFGTLYLAKLAWAGIVAAAAAAFTGLCYFVSGCLIGLPAAQFPPQTVRWLFCGAAGCFVICAWQELISMCVRIFAVPVAIALVGGFSGLYAMAKGLGLLWPWSLLSLGMCANNPHRTVELFPFFAACAVLLLLPCLVAVQLNRCVDVKSE
jgi:ABC-2 type transport system permease protein